MEACCRWKRIRVAMGYHKLHIQEAIRVAMQSSANLCDILANMLITSRTFGTIKEG
ncbi:Uncharacterized protein APZ42_015277 [Daphnia magna]|uniref:Uncharacterized protein n=1 Tax=Daphnia magna TaxID=35525 RepID=A0A162PC04_9CRUS|nr:Uncharacterized protein APZ42_015277 [Daphnia magna]